MCKLDLDLPFAVTALGEVEGSPAIVLPGGPCRGPEYLGDLAGLADQHALVVLHPRGTPSSGGVSHGWWADAADVIALADALDLASIDLVAHSAGTRLALATAARFPTRVHSVALISPPATWLTGTRSDAESIAMTYAGTDALAAFSAMSVDAPDTEDSFREACQRQAPASYAQWTPVEQTHANVGAVSLAAARAWFADIPADATKRILATPPARSLVVGGDRDLLTGVKPVEDYAMALHAELALIEDCGHYPWVEQPAAFRRHLSTWLDTLR